MDNDLQPAQEQVDTEDIGRGLELLSNTTCKEDNTIAIDISAGGKNIYTGHRV